MKILIASDHAGFELKRKLKELLPQHEWIDLGPEDGSSVDYPDYATKLGKKIPKEADLGVLICGSGIGMSMAANKIPGIRAALVENPISAKLSKEHNNANVLCLGSRFLAPTYAAEITEAWLSASFAQEERHRRRVEKIDQIQSFESKT